MPLPADLIKQLDQADALVRTAETLRGAGDLNEAILDALEAGRDYRDDRAVQRAAIDSLVANFQSHGVVEAANVRAMNRRRAALVEHAGDVLTAWQDALEPHSAALAAAAAELPTHDLSNTAAIISAGLDAVQHWRDAQTAIAVWNAAASGFVAFAGAARINAQPRYLVFTDSDAAAVKPALAGGRQPDAWTLACHGVPLDLPTVDEFRARVERHEADDAAEYEQQQPALATTAYDT
ncbi:hypothetical protein ACX9NE_10405 [Mycobacterium sp. ML4]